MAWSIWWNRNQVAHKDSGTTPSQVWEMANRLLSEYKDACTLLALSPAPSPTAWQAPPSSFFKINTNGTALDGSPSCIGVAIRDYRGSLFAASSKILPAPFSAEITELDLGISRLPCHCWIRCSLNYPSYYWRWSGWWFGEHCAKH